MRLVGLVLGLAACGGGRVLIDEAVSAPQLDSPDDEGSARTLGTPDLDLAGLFFLSPGGNGRTCSSCHQPGEEFTVRPDGVSARFDATGGKDPLFLAHDGTVSPDLDLGTQSGRRRAFGLLLSKGLVRVQLAVPAGSEFEVIAVDDPYGFADDQQLSLFRRPLPVTNLTFLSAVMWDGRENHGTHSIHYDLREQADTAARTHLSTGGLTSAQKGELGGFGPGHVTAQEEDAAAGPLDALGASGGAELLASLTFTPGENDPFGPSFDPDVFTLFSAWGSLPGSSAAAQARRDIAAGEELFDRRAFIVRGVAGLNDELGAAAVTATCSTCHANPNVGNHPVARFFAIGVSDGARRTPDLPLYTLRNLADGRVVTTTDPGRAMVTGLWRDIGRMKPPILRGLAARSPYFHNGMFADINDLVDFYDQRFGINLTATEKRQLGMFLEAL
jgi:hypothetical protein